MLAAALVIGAVVLGITALRGSEDAGTTSPSPVSDGPSASQSASPSAEPSAGPSSNVMSASGSDELRKQLTAKGWSCYDSLDNPIVKRCFYYKPDGTGSETTGVLSLQYADADSVGSMSVRAESPSSAQSALLQEVAGLAGDALLDGNGAKLQQIQQSSTTEGAELAGMRVFGSDSSFNVYAPDTGFASADSPPFPPLATTRAAWEKQGLRCATKAGVLSCEGTKSGLQVRAIAALRDGKVAGGWSLSVSPPFDKGVSVEDGAMTAGALLKAAGLTDGAGAAFIGSHARNGEQGDFAQRHVRLTISTSADFYSMIVSVDDVR